MVITACQQPGRIRFDDRQAMSALMGKGRPPHPSPQNLFADMSGAAGQPPSSAEPEALAFITAQELMRSTHGMELDRARPTANTAGIGEDALVAALWVRGIRVFARTGGEATLGVSQRETLTYYYQAATYLQVLEQAHLTANRPLRDYFSTKLSLPVASHLSNQPLQLEKALQDTARLQARATGLDLNLVDAYKKAAQFALRKTRHAASPHRARSSH